ncbi:protein VAPYRIN-like isoform X2 [Stegodyphus dumicola]|uniref:protein VAPYRIN-like isoform X2 n=1 Tax=Stegodyphus dumicola TaxID=202533 RepID=UPI0015B34216|nr:protein VAPYRIN-like isoform X2 [Stegodyphus dumicola]
MDSEGQTALHIDCRNSSLEIIQLLLESRGRSILDKCDQFGRRPLRIACTRSSPEVVQYLLENGASIEKEGCLLLTALNHIYRSYIHRIISTLLDYGADINMCSSSGTTSLLKDVERASHTRKSSYMRLYLPYEHLSLADLLIDCGANLHTHSCDDCIAMYGNGFPDKSPLDESARDKSPL